MRKIEIPVAAKHGISDPRINNRQRLRFESQVVRLERIAVDKSQLMPEFIKVLGGDANTTYDIKLIDLFSYVPAIHRTYINVTNGKPIFLPIKEIKIFCDGSGNVWYRIVFNKNDKDVIECLPKFKSKLRQQKIKLVQVSSPNSERWYESYSYNNGNRWVSKAIYSAAQDLCRMGVYTILTNRGYRLYFNVDRKENFSQLAVSLAIIFYLGSITRYKPHDYDKILRGKYGLLLNEFLSTQPIQFLYILLSYIKGTFVVKPYATFE